MLYNEPRVLERIPNWGVRASLVGGHGGRQPSGDYNFPTSGTQPSPPPNGKCICQNGNCICQKWNRMYLRPGPHPTTCEVYLSKIENGICDYISLSSWTGDLISVHLPLYSYPTRCTLSQVTGKLVWWLMTKVFKSLEMKECKDIWIKAKDFWQCDRVQRRISFNFE